MVDTMNTTRVARRAAAIGGLTAALGIASALGGAVANAGSGHGVTPKVKVGVVTAPSMKLPTSPDEKINPTAIQGSLRTSGTDGTVESPMQCDSTSSIAKVDCDIQSPEATPQFKAG
jgi:hypothetical protein